jgi:hypothetical protein
LPDLPVPDFAWPLDMPKKEVHRFRIGVLATYRFDNAAIRRAESTAELATRASSLSVDTK